MKSDEQYHVRLLFIDFNSTGKHGFNKMICVGCCAEIRENRLK